MLDLNPLVPSQATQPSRENLQSNGHPLQGTEDRQTQGEFVGRHNGSDSEAIGQMLEVLGLSSLDELIDRVVPGAIRMRSPLNLPAATSEYEALKELKAIASRNRVYRSFLGMGYHGCITPPVIQRNILENPGWYTAYTPYQAEIAQGRLEALLNFQTMVMDLTGMEIANASLLDEGTAAAEAMSMSYGVCKNKANAFFVSADCHPQTIDVVRTRANPLGIEVIVGDWQSFDFETPIFGALLQYPATDGAIYDYSEFVAKAHETKAIVTVAADLISLALLTPPGEFGADIVVGSSQRFGVPMGYGGPHAAYFATREAYKRQIPGRMVGVSKDANGKPALRLALQTREQHIRRDKATSNICTAQVLLAVMASMYAVYHGAEGIRDIARRVARLAATLGKGLQELGFVLGDAPYFDTVRVKLGDRPVKAILTAAEARQINLRVLRGGFDEGTIAISLDETTTPADLVDLWQIFAGTETLPFTFKAIYSTIESPIAPQFARTSPYLTQPVFNAYHSETELLRYLHRLFEKDLSLTTSMIPLGSCTMKLNATAEMIPVTWPEFGQIHPFAPTSQTEGYREMFRQLEAWLAEITGFAGVSLQPNAGSQGEYAGLQAIRAYHQSRE
ncbi:aminomethyl-transferring glycine dehydrogenase, partial [Oscillatoriales cyanobacterium LEGE 11467]